MIEEIDSKYLKKQLENGAILIDVRETSEYQEESIEGALSVPLSTLDPKSLLNLCGNREIIFHCKSGKRSMKAAQKLADLNKSGVYTLVGGIEDWKRCKLPTKKSSKEIMSMFRQVQIVAGSLALIGVVLGFVISSQFFFLSGFIGAGLLFAGVTNTCGMAVLLSKMPWNK